jgi:NAD-dependent dihydropyrimidine dehydrogenase PreA subunit
MVRPVRLPAWLLPALRPIPWLYLGAAVLLAATGAGFVVCRFDPFVGFFRLGATFPMLVTGALFLLAGMFIARPYCRFFCPYGAILGACSFISRRHVTITPDECVHCRLCEDSCPFGAIRPPTPDRPPEARRAGVARLAAVLLALPVLALAGAAAGARLGPALARLHPAVRLAGLLRMEDRGAPAGSTLETQTFRETKTPPEKVHAESRRVGERSAAAGGWLGAFTGLVFGANILALSLRRTRKDYTPDPVSCLSCARCFRRCPREWLRLKAAGKDREGRRGDRTV